MSAVYIEYSLSGSTAPVALLHYSKFIWCYKLNLRYACRRCVNSTERKSTPINTSGSYIADLSPGWGELNTAAKISNSRNSVKSVGGGDAIDLFVLALY